jgi:polyhydroxyalkanoate synthase
MSPAEAMREGADVAARLARGTRLFAEIGEVDVRIATTPKDTVLRQDKVTLYRYRPLAERRIGVPLLICYGLIGRWTMADLQEDRSLVRNLLSLGIDLYVVDWGNPGRAERFLTLDDYIEGYLGECVRHIAQASGMPRVSLLGICEGGVFATCYAALHPEDVQALVLTITPIDFHADAAGGERGGRSGFLNLWTRNLPPEEIDRLIEAHGSLPGEFLGSIFSMLTPMQSRTKYGLDLLDTLDDREKLLTFLRMERWLADRPHHPGEAARQWLRDLYQDNKLVRNELVLGGRRVDLGAITCPVLNVFATEDHIVPPATSQALAHLVGTDDYTELPLPGGHIGIFVGRRGNALLGRSIAAWLEQRDLRADP